MDYINFPGLFNKCWMEKTMEKTKEIFFFYQFDTTRDESLKRYTWVIQSKEMRNN